MVCNLCKRNESNQTGSHITSAFLLTSQIGKRGEERGFLITTDPNQDYSENKGAEGIKENFIFCRDCEKRLSFIENIYSTEITQKIENKKFKQNFEEVKTKHGVLLICKRIEPIIFHLLVYSNIWRASISTKPIYNNFKLSSDTEEQLRFLLDLFLPETTNHKIEVDTNKWLKTVRECKDFFHLYPYIILKAEKLYNKELTYEFLYNVTHFPNHIILNEYVILSFFNQVEWREDFFEIKNEIEFSDLLNNSIDEIKIGILSNERYLRIIELIKSLAVEQRLRRLEKLCIMELTMHGLPINQDTVKKLMKQKVNEIQVSN